MILNPFCIGVALVAMALGALIAFMWQQSRVSALTERLAASERESQEKLSWVDGAQHTLREAFQSLAAQTLQTNAEEFIKRAQDQLNTVAEKLRGDWGTQKEAMKGLVDPLQQSLKTLDTQVQALEQKREGAYRGLETQLQQLLQAHSQLQITTATLAQALKSSSVRGKWGEFQLRRVVELAGMVRHVDFDEQTATDEGRPDMVIRLPNEGILPVDAKTPMQAYLSAMEATDEQARTVLLNEHTQAIRNRIRELSQRKYWLQFERAPDFVVMFVPNDSCLSSAFDRDPELLNNAIQQRVLPTTPVTLLALLKTVAYGWQQQQIAESAHAIAEAGRQLHERLGTFTGYLADLGRRLNQSVQDYNKAVGSMESRVMPSARRLREMGVAASDIPPLESIEHQTRIPLVPEPLEDQPGLEN